MKIIAKMHPTDHDYVELYSRVYNGHWNKQYMASVHIDMFEKELREEIENSEVVVLRLCFD